MRPNRGSIATRPLSVQPHLDALARPVKLAQPCRELAAQDRLRNVQAARQPLERLPRRELVKQRHVLAERAEHEPARVHAVRR